RAALAQFLAKQRRGDSEGRWKLSNIRQGTLNQVRQSLTVAPGSLLKRSALVRNTARSRSSTWRASGTGFIAQMNTWGKSIAVPLTRQEIGRRRINLLSELNTPSASV